MLVDLTLVGERSEELIVTGDDRADDDRSTKSFVLHSNFEEKDAHDASSKLLVVGDVFGIRHFFIGKNIFPSICSNGVFSLSRIYLPCCTQFEISLLGLLSFEQSEILFFWNLMLVIELKPCYI